MNICVSCMVLPISENRQPKFCGEMGKQMLDNLPVSLNEQVSCLFCEMGKILAYFNKWAILQIVRNIYIKLSNYFEAASQFVTVPTQLTLVNPD